MGPPRIECGSVRTRGTREVMKACRPPRGDGAGDGKIVDDLHVLLKLGSLEVQYADGADDLGANAGEGSGTLWKCGCGRKSILQRKSLISPVDWISVSSPRSSAERSSVSVSWSRSEAVTEAQPGRGVGGRKPTEAAGASAMMTARHVSGCWSAGSWVGHGAVLSFLDLSWRGVRRVNSRNGPPRLKPPSFLALLARLKPCPDVKLCLNGAERLTGDGRRTGVQKGECKDHDVWCH